MLVIAKTVYLKWLFITIVCVCVCESYGDVKWNQHSLLWGSEKKEKLIGVIICQSLRLHTGKFSLRPPEGQINFTFFFFLIAFLGFPRRDSVLGFGKL